MLFYTCDYKKRYCIDPNLRRTFCLFLVKSEVYLTIKYVVNRLFNYYLMTSFAYSGQCRYLGIFKIITQLLGFVIDYITFRNLSQYRFSRQCIWNKSGHITEIESGTLITEVRLRFETKKKIPTEGPENWGAFSNFNEKKIDMK